MAEQTLIRLLALLGALAFVGCWLLARALVGRRKARFFSVAAALGGRPQAVNDFLHRFEAPVEGRAFDVRCQHLGGGDQDGSSWTPDWYLVTSTRLRGVADVHSAELRPRRSGALRAPMPTEGDFTVRDSGYPLPAGWFDAAVARALGEFYAGPPREALSIESGALVHRSRSLLRRLDAPTLQELLRRQAAVASALEDAF